MMDPLVILYLVVALAAVMWVLGWMRRDSPLAPSYLWLTSAFLVWTLAYVWELEASTLEGMVLAAKVQYLGIPFVPPAILAFCIRYTAHERRPAPWTLVAFLLVPVATTVLAWTNELHGLIWNRIEITPVGARSLLSLGYGGFFPVYVAVSYAYLLAALLLSVRTWMRSTELARRQSRLIAAALVFPWVANILQISGLNPLHPLDLTPMALVFSCGFAAVGALNLRMLTLAPVARDQILAATTDGIVVLDETGRVVDVNEAAAVLLGRRAAEAVGQEGATVLGPFAAAVNANPDGGTLVTTECDGEDRSFHCTWFDVTSRSGRQLGGALAIGM